MKDTELAWAAGFFDGEGCIYMVGNCPYVYLSQKDKRPVDKFLAIVGEGKIYYSERKTPSGKPTHTNTYYTWR